MLGYVMLVTNELTWLTLITAMIPKKKKKTSPVHRKELKLNK